MKEKLEKFQEEIVNKIISKEAKITLSENNSVGYLAYVKCEFVDENGDKYFEITCSLHNGWICHHSDILKSLEDESELEKRLHKFLLEEYEKDKSEMLLRQEEELKKKLEEIQKKLEEK